MVSHPSIVNATGESMTPRMRPGAMQFALLFSLRRAKRHQELLLHEKCSCFLLQRHRQPPPKAHRCRPGLGFVAVMHCILSLLRILALHPSRLLSLLEAAYQFIRGIGVVPFTLSVCSVCGWKSGKSQTQFRSPPDTFLPSEVMKRKRGRYLACIELEKSTVSHFGMFCTCATQTCLFFTFWTQILTHHKIGEETRSKRCLLIGDGMQSVLTTRFVS
jgi:hypothetical protein